MSERIVSGDKAIDHGQVESVKKKTKLANPLDEVMKISFVDLPKPENNISSAREDDYEEDGAEQPDSDMESYVSGSTNKTEGTTRIGTKLNDIQEGGKVLE